MSAAAAGIPQPRRRRAIGDVEAVPGAHPPLAEGATRAERCTGTATGAEAHGRIGCSGAGNGGAALRTRRWLKPLKSAVTPATGPPVSAGSSVARWRRRGGLLLREGARHARLRPDGTAHQRIVGQEQRGSPRRTRSALIGHHPSQRFGAGSSALGLPGAGIGLGRPGAGSCSSERGPRASRCCFGGTGASFSPVHQAFRPESVLASVKAGASLASAGNAGADCGTLASAGALRNVRGASVPGWDASSGVCRPAFTPGRASVRCGAMNQRMRVPRRMLLRHCLTQDSRPTARNPSQGATSVVWRGRLMTGGTPRLSDWHGRRDLRAPENAPGQVPDSSSWGGWARCCTDCFGGRGRHRERQERQEGTQLQ